MGAPNRALGSLELSRWARVWKGRKLLKETADISGEPTQVGGSAITSWRHGAVGETAEWSRRRNSRFERQELAGSGMAGFGDRNGQADVSCCIASWQVSIVDVRKPRRKLHLFIRSLPGLIMNLGRLWNKTVFTQPGSKPACRPQGSAKMPDEVLTPAGI
jgi:hypothetical protein